MQRPLAQENWLGGQVRAGDRDGHEYSQSCFPLLISFSFLLFSAYEKVFPRSQSHFS